MAGVETSSVARAASLRAVFAALLQAGEVSRAELSRLTGLSKQTTSEIVKVLHDEGWIRSSGRTNGALGRKAVTWRVEPGSAFVIGVDLGGTKVQVSLANLLGVVVAGATQPTSARGGLHVVDQIRTMVADLAAQTGIVHAQIRAGTVGCPGVVQPRTGEIHFAPNIAGLDGFDVVSAFNDALGFPVQVENDVNLAAVGERQHASRRTVTDMVFIALGTGIGMGIVAGGQLVRGARGAAGEAAYLPLGADPFDSRGYRFGTLETAVGSRSILERYRNLGGDPALDVRGIFDRLIANDLAAAATIEEIARLATQTIMVARAMLDPEIIVFGGSIGARPELLDRIVGSQASMSGLIPSSRRACSAAGRCRSAPSNLPCRACIAISSSARVSLPA